MIPLLDTHQHLVYRNEANYSFDKLFEKYNVSVNYTQSNLKW